MNISFDKGGASEMGEDVIRLDENSWEWEGNKKVILGIIMESVKQIKL